MSNLNPQQHYRGEYRGSAFQDWRTQTTRSPYEEPANWANQQRAAETDGDYWRPRALENSPRQAELPNRAARGMSEQENRTDHEQAR